MLPYVSNLFCRSYLHKFIPFALTVDVLRPIWLHLYRKITIFEIKMKHTKQIPPDRKPHLWEQQVFNYTLTTSKKKTERSIESVSYTHLDVYKRQGM